MKWIVGAYVVASLITFVVYGFDKRRAGRGGRRVSERTLHLLELVGGWPGALVAGRMFHHKTAKTSYRVVRGAIVVLHLAAWGWWIAGR